MDISILGPLSLSRQNRIILVRRMPPTKTLRAHLFGLTLGLVGAFFTIVWDYGALIHGLPWYAALVVIGIFILGTYLGGPFVMLTAILFFLMDKQPPVPPTFFSSLTILAAWYFLLYALGAIFSMLYNVLVFWDLITFGKKQVKIAFAYDTTLILHQCALSFVIGCAL